MRTLVKVTIDWWLSPYGRDDVIPMVGVDMTDHGYVKVFSEDVMVYKPAVDPDKCQLESLKQQRAAAALRKEQELAEYDRRIEELSRGK